VTERKFKVGDLIYEQHFLERKGIVVEVLRTHHDEAQQQVVVEWVGRNPNAHSNPEKIEERYIVLLSRKEK